MIYRRLPHNRWGHAYRWLHARLRGTRMVLCSCGYEFREFRRMRESATTASARKQP